MYSPCKFHRVPRIRPLPRLIFEGCLQRNHHLGRVRPGLGMEWKERKMKIKEFKSLCVHLFIFLSVCVVALILLFSFVRGPPRSCQRIPEALPEAARDLQSLWELLERSCLVDSGNGRSYQRQSQIFAFGAPRHFWKPLEGVYPKEIYV